MQVLINTAESCFSFLEGCRAKVSYVTLRCCRVIVPRVTSSTEEGLAGASSPDKLETVTLSSYELQAPPHLSVTLFVKVFFLGYRTHHLG